ncbi:hypothetical protein [Gallionella capsiferriformans]|uniref:Uncharacterized protein n=1 Tax=Gallionella capsiferriformans (strain ES-2) TaxID=395494 RepID=D9SDW0_GALCS|nr:hypothetical protein [Gallionella capsiferriformans]ADL56782.1 hypothetical protein Galf_2789 [Gallionella capsiferriformans ES-2]
MSKKIVATILLVALFLPLTTSAKEVKNKTNNGEKPKSESINGEKPKSESIWTPTPFDASLQKLPANYIGLEIGEFESGLHKSLIKNHFYKDEYETMEEWNQRILRDGPQMILPIDALSKYAIKISLTSQYDAESQAYNFYFEDDDGFATRSYTFNKNLSIHIHTGTINTGSYVAQNGYGERFNVDVQKVNRYHILFTERNQDKLKEKIGYAEKLSYGEVKTLRYVLPMPRSQAQEYKGLNIGMLFVGKLHTPYLQIYGRGTAPPTSSNRTNRDIYDRELHMDDAEIIFYVVETGDILSRRPL